MNERDRPDEQSIQEPASCASTLGGSYERDNSAHHQPEDYDSHLRASQKFESATAHLKSVTCEFHRGRA
jgi:hypothetical protein